MTAVLRMPPPTDGALQLLSSQGFVQYHPILADKLGSFKAALFLGHALYWARHVQTNYQSRDGWFFLSAKQCTEATGLSAREQASARQLLIEHSLLAEMLAGRPAKLHYKVDLQQLSLFLGLSILDRTPSWKELLPLFNGCVSFYRPLAVITGNVASGLYLSYLLNQHRHFLAYPRQGSGFTVSQSALRNALCLGPKTQRNARDRLKQIGLLIEHGNLLQINLQALSALLQGQESKPLKQARKPANAGNTPQAAPTLALVKPAQSATTGANSKRLFKAAAISQKQLFGLHTVASAHAAQRPELGSALADRRADQSLIVEALRSPGIKAGRLFGRLAGNRQTATASLQASVCQTGAESAKLELQLAENANQLAESAKLSCPKRKTKLPKTQNINTTNKQTTTNTAQAVDNFDPSEDAEAECRRSPSSQSSNTPQTGPATGQEATQDAVQGMAMPIGLQACWHDAVRRVLAKARPEQRQPLLDELEGQLSNPLKTINNPPGYLHSLRVAMERGSVALAHAETVAAQRTERERIDKAIKSHEMRQAAADAATPSMSREAARAKLRQLRTELRGSR